MFPFIGILLTTIFLIFIVGFVDFFVKSPGENSCQMTYMYQMPQYVNIDLGSSLRKHFSNYHLYAYGEGQYADTLRLNQFNGNPVLFVPGNGGSYKQVRSLASVALVMFYSKSSSHLNYFAIDYNEDLSAFIGEKLDDQIKFLYFSIKKIVFLYKHVPNIKIVLVGHSVGGVLIKSLISKSYFRDYLKYIALVITLATPHRFPAIPYDNKIVNFYSDLNSFYSTHRDEPDFSNINFISIGGSYRDRIIRSDLIDLNSDHPYDRSALSTALNNVWSSADHLCIVWCRQLVIKLNQLIYSLIDTNTLTLLSSTERRQQLIDYHLFKQQFMLEFSFSGVLNKTNFLDENIWIEHKDRLISLNITKIFKPTNHLIPLNPRETIVVHVEGLFKPDTISVCNATSLNGKLICTEKSLSLYSHVRLVPSGFNVDCHLGHFESDSFLDVGYSHLVVRLTPSKLAYKVLIDRFTTHVRQKSISMPSFWDLVIAGQILFPKTVFRKLISQEHTFFNLTFDNYDNVWHTYWASMQTKSCYKASSSFIGYGYLSFPNSHMSEYIWPFMPVKDNIYDFNLRYNLAYKLDRKPTLLLYLEPNCGFELIVKYSIIDSSAQLLKHYFAILIPMIISTIILLLSIQFSNVVLQFSVSNEEFVSFKDQCNKEEIELDSNCSKCYVFMSTFEIMINWRYFSYCYLQILFSSMVSLHVLKRLYPFHDLSNLSQLSPVAMLTICTILFLFAYSLVYLSTSLFFILANYFASGINFVYTRFQKVNSIKWKIKSSIKLRFNIFASITLALLFVWGYMFFIYINFYIVNGLFTILMLTRFILVHNLEQRIGRTTSSSFILAIYPVIYSLLLVMTVLYIPQSVDWFRSSLGTRKIFTIGQAKQSMIFHYRECIQSLVLILVYLFIYYKPLKLDARITSSFTSKFQTALNVALILLAFLNMLVGSFAFEYIKYIVLATLAVTMAHTSVLHRLASEKSCQLKTD